MKRLGIIGAVVAVALIGGLLVWRSGGDSGSGSGRDLLITAQVDRRTLLDAVTVRGVVERSELRTVYAAENGRVSGVAVDDGATVAAGDTIMTVEGRPVVAVAGALPFYRPLDVGAEGPDVRQLETILRDAGFEPGPVDHVYTEATRAALAGWQAQRGYPGGAPETEETVTVSLSPGNGYTIGPRASAAVTIGPGGSAPRGVRSPGAAVLAQASPPLARILTGDFDGFEGETYEVEVILEFALASNTTIPITFGGTASPGTDFTAPSSVLIPAGATSVLFDVAIVDDGADEPQETIVLGLGTGPTYAVAYPSSTTITVPDGAIEIELTLQADNAVVNEGGQAVFTLSASEEAVEDVDVQIGFAGTATPGADYTRPQTVTLSDGQDLVRVQLPVSEDGLIEADETIELALFPGDGYAVGTPNRATITVRSAERPELTITGGGPTGEGTVRTLTVRADAAPARDTAIPLEVTGTASSGTDYVALPSTVLLPAGQTVVSVDVQTLADDIRERPETVVVSLGRSATNAYDLAPVASQTVTIDEADTSLPLLSLRADTQTTDEGRSPTFTVEADRRLDDDLELRFTLGGTATQGVDVDPPAGRIVMETGRRSQMVTVNVRQDNLVEPDETVTLSLSGTAGYRVALQYAATTVIQDDDVPELSLSGGGTIAEGGAGGLTITADQAPVEDVSVAYQVVGTAQPGVDFLPVSGTALLRAGTTSVGVALRAIDDDVVFQPTDMVVGAWPARIGTVAVDEGEAVAPGAPLFTITEPEFTITLRATATDRSQLVVGQEVDVTVEAGGQETRGVIVELDEVATVDEATGAEQYEGTVQITEQVVAVDGASVTLEVILDERVDAIVVPIAAVSQTADGTDEVRVIDLETGEFLRVPVETGLQEGSYIEIVSGLDGDEVVVVEVDAA